MLVVNVEVWPGGDIRRRRVISVMGLANISELAETSDYEGYIDGKYVEYHGHQRSDGTWELIRKLLNQEHVEKPKAPHTYGGTDAPECTTCSEILPPAIAVVPTQAEAMCRLLIDSGDMTPMAALQLRKLWSTDGS